MQNSWLPSDQELPTWLHTALLVLIVSLFAVPLFWIGMGAIVSGHLEPLSGPELGQSFFGPLPLDGHAARLAGFTLILFAGYFVALAAHFSRFGEESIVFRWLPWAILAATLALSFCVKLPRESIGQTTRSPAHQFSPGGTISRDIIRSISAFGVQ